MALEVGEELHEAEIAWPKKVRGGVGWGGGGAHSGLRRWKFVRETCLSAALGTGKSLFRHLLIPCIRDVLKKKSSSGGWTGGTLPRCLPVQEHLVSECGIGIQKPGFASSSVVTTFNCLRHALALFEKFSVERIH